jgi:methylated-DNA-[protein]-cysteine S-methyltransferase
VDEHLLMTPIETSIGCFRALFSERGLRRLCFPDASPPSPTPGEGQGGRAAESDLARELNDYLEGRLERFTVAIDLQGTAFQREVWGHVLEIPYGATRTYSEVAQALGRPLSARAVGAANGANPVPILVPCHRLVGASGGLTGYGGGIELKRWLLRLESGGG